MDYLKQLIDDYNDGLVDLTNTLNRLDFLDWKENSKPMPEDYAKLPRDPLDIIVEAERHDELTAALKELRMHLSSDNWEILVMIADGRTQEEIGERFGISHQAIGKRNHPLWKTRRNNMPWFDNPDQHLRSTAEMIADFAPWLGEEYAREIVATNSNLIADQIGTDAIPVSKDTFTPNENLPNSEKILRDLCEKNFQDRYGGNPDPEVQKRVAEVHERLSRELSGIIDHGYAVTYYIAHCLIKMAAEEPEHYIVGSRGSVGSSFAATMADITEVNPLPPHYRCPKCHYFEWGDTTKYKSGFDMPDKECPHCHEKLEANGQNIPFQTFLGFNAEKVPDIDLNFEDESQHKAHNYTKILLGANKVFRAGTIEKVAEKTAYGYVKHYYEVRGKDPNELNGQWINFLASKVEGVKRTTGQHPGGIVVVPKEHDVTDFTAIQHPADDIVPCTMSF